MEHLKGRQNYRCGVIFVQLQVTLRERRLPFPGEHARTCVHQRFRHREGFYGFLRHLKTIGGSGTRSKPNQGLSGWLRSGSNPRFGMRHDGPCDPPLEPLGTILTPAAPTPAAV
jgi:hypothetical protein